MLDQTTEPKLRTYTTRFFVALFFSLMGMTNALMYTTFSPLVTQMQSIYNLDLQTVTFGTMMISNIGYIPSLFVANYIIAKTNLRAGIIIGSVLTVLGLWIRIMASSGFVWIFLG
jgi:fucose permease